MGRSHTHAAGLLAALVFAGVALGQDGGGAYTLDRDGRWVPVEARDVSADEATVTRARVLLAEGNATAAFSILDAWIESLDGKANPYLAEALLRRGDALVTLGEEFDALYDYENIAKNHASSEQFVLALERQMEIAIRYLGGLNKKWLGLRIEGAEDIGEELLLRVQERMPGSQLAERACIELADYYYRTRDLPMASEAYRILLENFPQSEYRQRAMLRLVYSTIAQFKGPEYDATVLIGAQQLVRRFVREFPIEAERVGVGDALLSRLDESAAAQMLTSARWHLRRSDEPSARLVLRRLVRKHPQTVASREAMELMKERGWPLPPDGVTPVAPATPEDAR